MGKKISTTCYEKTNGPKRKSRRKLKKKYLKTNDNEGKTYQNLWDATKAVLRGKFIPIQAFLKKEEESQIDNFTQHLNELEKGNQKETKKIT